MHTRKTVRGSLSKGLAAAAFSAILVVVPGSPAGNSGGALPARGAASANVARETLAQKLAAGALSANFQPSLEMRESVDFLLTPAFLVQEALSEDVGITYPAN